MSSEQSASMEVIYEAIRDGADAFLMAEYKICFVFVGCFSGVIYGLIGALTSMLSGYIGMKVAVFANARTTIEAASGRDEAERFMGAFNMAFRAGGVMGFSLCGLGLLVLWCLLWVYKTFVYPDAEDMDFMMDCISGYGLG